MKNCRFGLNCRIPCHSNSLRSRLTHFKYVIMYFSLNNLYRVSELEQLTLAEGIVRLN